MGVFQELVPVINRTSQPLTVRFDGQEMTLVPGLNHIPKQTVPYAKKQNPVMGSEDFRNPLRYQSLVGVVGKDDCTPLEQSTEPARVSVQQLAEEKGQDYIVRGKRPHNAFDAMASLSPDGRDLVADV